MVSATKKVIDPERFNHETGQDQYYHIYNIRLKQARPALIERARYRWGNDVRNVPIEQLNASLGSEDVFVIGTIFKSMPKQPSILREVEGNEAPPVDANTNFTSDDDFLILHETEELVRIVGDINPHEHVTGIPIALLGHQLDDGSKFEVTDICYSGPILSVYKELKSNGTTSNGNTTRDFSKMLIFSGLEFGLEKTLTEEKQKLFFNALKKLKDLIVEDKNIKKVVIAGNSCLSSNSKDRLEMFRIFDNFLLHIGQGNASVEIMPGHNDPTSCLLPQQPFHPTILPKSGPLKNIHPNTNPCLFNIEDLTVLGSSGEIVDVIHQHSRIEYSTTILRSTLEWGHIAPSAPDNLSCMPFKNTDPFLIDFVPDIYFAGNQSEFAVTTYCTETKPKIQIISVPKFSKTQSVVQVNLSNLDVEEINILVQ